MSIDVKPDWWKTLFDDLYLVTDARTVGDQALTQREVDLICELVPLRNGHNILDLCGGQGRHSLELCRRGFSGCTVFDYSNHLLEIGARKAKDLNYTIDFVQGDARNVSMPSASFHHVLILGNSLGYTGNSGADLDILREAHRLLDPFGWIAIDVTNGRSVRDHFNPNAWHEIGDDIVVCRQRELYGDMVRAREMVIHKQSGVLRDQTYGMHLYEAQSLESLLYNAGFGAVRLHEDFTPYRGRGDVGFMDHRIMATAQK